MWRVASEAHAYLAGHPFLTDTVLHNRKTENEQATYSRRNQSKYKSAHTHTQKKIKLKKARIVVVCVPI